MADLHLHHSSDPEALLLHAAAPFLTAGRPTGPLPLLVLRQGTLRDKVTDRAARAGCAGWFGEPLVVFSELPVRLGVEHAPLTARDRTVLLRQLMRENGLAHLERSCMHPSMLQALDALIGDFCAERIVPEQLDEALGTVAHDAWDERRNAEVRTLYRAYLGALQALPEHDGRPRCDGRDGLALAAELLRGRPDLVRARLRRPFSVGGEPCAIRIAGLMDLRRGWLRLLDALRESDVVDELSVYLQEPDGLAEREALSDHELWDHLAPHATSVHAVPALARAAGLAALHDALFRTDAGMASDAGVPISALAAPDEEREAEEIARRVKRLIVEEAVAPERIAVVMRESRPYAPLVAEALRRAGVPVSARLRHPPTESGAVAALLGVLRAAGYGWTVRELARVAESPYFDLALDVGALRWLGAVAPLGALDEWETALASLATRRDNDGEEGRRGAPNPVRAGAALEAFCIFRATVGPLAAARRLSEWITTTRDLLGAGDTDADGLWRLRASAERVPGLLDDALAVDAVRFDCRALDTLDRVLVEWMGALALDPTADRETTAAEWHDELATALEAEEVVLHAPHQRGVQVLEAFAAVGRPWEHLFVVGMSSGAFPADPAPRPLYSDTERAALHAAGLPLDTQEVWYAREAALFRALLATARRSVTLSYAYAGPDGGTRLPSAHFEEVRERLGHAEAEAWAEVIPGSRVVPDALDAVWSRAELALYAARAWREPETQDGARAALGHLHGDPAWTARIEQVVHAAHIDELRVVGHAAAPEERNGAAHAWNGRIEAPELRAGLETRFGDAVWSASQLETYGNCPWSFFARYVLRLDAASEPGDDLDGATRGSLLHRCLERVYGDLSDRCGDGALHPDHLDYAEERLRAVIPEVMQEAAAHGWTGAEALRAARQQELFETLRRYIRWEMEQNAAEHHTRPLRRAMREHEVVFGMDGAPPAELESSGRALRLRGKIDRIDTITDERAEGWLYVVDHKSGAGAFASAERRYEEGVILQLPLYLRVAEQHHPNAPGTWGGSYQIVRDPSRKAPLHLVSYTKTRGLSGEGAAQQKAIGQVDGALQHALDHVDAIRGGVFPARLPACVKECPSYCDFLEICREHVGKESDS